MKDKFIRYYMDIAYRTAALSSATKLKVGCVIVKGDQTIGTGYNGTPSGWDNTCENKISQPCGAIALETKPEVLHSEMNALMKVCRSHESSVGSILFCTHSPCIDCAKAIYQAGINTVIYDNQYRSSDGIDFLKKCGVIVEQYRNDEH